MKYRFLFTFLSAGLLFSCNNKEAQQQETQQSSEPVTEAAPAKPWNETDGIYASIYTAKGKMVCKLEYEKTPVTCASFIGLSEGGIDNTHCKTGKPFYDGLTFHRVEPGFVIQGGDPNGDGSGGPGYQFKNEYTPELRHSSKGVLAMANAGPGTNGSQFYISMKALPQLDGGNYTVFGNTVEGLEVIDVISKGEKIDSIRITRVGAAAQAFNAPQSFKAYLDNKVNEEKQAAEAWDKKVQAKFPNAKKTKSGLYYLVEKEGKGKKAGNGSDVYVHYTGTLWDGLKFDSSLDRNEPFNFKLGMGMVIKGWDEGIALMKEGAKVKLIIPSYLGYGASGTPGGPIPPNADLIFDTELLKVK